jgi:hypothetical protein
LLIALAITIAWLQGERTTIGGKSSYICRPKETGRTKRRHSKFWIGLYGYNWIAAFHECQDWVEELITSVRNKVHHKSFRQTPDAWKLVARTQSAGFYGVFDLLH